MTDITDSFNEWRRDEGLPEMPVIWEVCYHCHGEGKLGGYPGVYTQDDFAEDPDMFYDYMQHRRQCETCRGRTTIRVADIVGADPDTRAAWMRFAREVTDSDAIEAQERSMGA
jgi:hypothetical protein